jgi:peptidoglycan/LPS O-acetylase OafA/YrhL
MVRGDKPLSKQKILGLELLRGLCALLVANYHCLNWSHTALLPTWGLYGVYVFFGISGAVLHYNYHDALTLDAGGQGGLSVARFLLKRFARLAPLCWACILIPAIGRNSWVPDQYFLNLTFLNGFGSPGHTSYLTGGWTLAIEFVLYALFPTLLSLTRNMRAMVLTLLVLVLVRVAFVSFVLKDSTLMDAWVIYTEPAAFLAFFFGGMVTARVLTEVPRPQLAFLATGAACGFILVAFPGTNFEEVILGWRGLALTLVSMAIVAAFYWSPASRLGATVSQFFGDVSYGVYLMHPLVWAATFRYLPPLTAPTRILTTIALATAAAWLSLRFYERPVRIWILRR